MGKNKHLFAFFAFATFVLAHAEDPWKINENLQKVVIDTDGGPDDAGAILLLLAAEKRSQMRIVGITCSYGNAFVDQTVKNVLRTLMTVNRTDIPVYRGAHQPWNNLHMTTDYFGVDGFGQVNFTEDLNVDPYDFRKSAHIALSELAAKHRSELTVIILGPLTNMATIIANNSTFLNIVHNVYAMGGQLNDSQSKEFNFSPDYEANDYVLKAFSRSSKVLNLLPKETCREAVELIPKNWRTEIFGKPSCRICSFSDKIEELYLKREGKWSSADAMMAAVMLWPNLTNIRQVNATVTRNTTLIVARGKANVNLFESLDTENFLSLTNEYIKDL